MYNTILAQTATDKNRQDKAEQLLTRLMFLEVKGWPPIGMGLMSSSLGFTETSLFAQIMKL